MVHSNYTGNANTDVIFINGMPIDTNHSMVTWNDSHGFTYTGTFDDYLEHIGSNAICNHYYD